MERTWHQNDDIVGISEYLDGILPTGNHNDGIWWDWGMYSVMKRVHNIDSRMYLAVVIILDDKEPVLKLEITSYDQEHPGYAYEACRIATFPLSDPECFDNLKTKMSELINAPMV